MSKWTVPLGGGSPLAVLTRAAPATLRLLVNAVALVVLVALFAALNDKFLTLTNFTNVLHQVSVVVTVGCFFTLLMVCGGIDLSVGGVLAVSGMVSILLVNAGAPLPVALAAAVTLGALVGAWNGLLVAVVGINTVIATLGTMYVTRGANLVLGGGNTPLPKDPGYAFIGHGDIGPVPVMVIIMVVVFLIAVVLERRTSIGRFAVLVGSNPRGAWLSGVPVRTVQTALFVLTGAAAGLAGVMVSSEASAALPRAGTGFEFELIIATLLGGTSLFGGEGSVVGLLLGALIVGTATTGMNFIGVPPFVQTVLLGAVLIAAVGADAAVRARRERPARRPAVQGGAA